MYELIQHDLVYQNGDECSCVLNEKELRMFLRDRIMYEDENEFFGNLWVSGVLDSQVEKNLREHIGKNIMDESRVSIYDVIWIIQENLDLGILDGVKGGYQVKELK